VSDDHSARPIRYLVFSASLRDESFNTRLARLAADVIAAQGGVVDFASFAEFDAPSFNGDEEVANHYPPGPIELDRRLKNSDAFVISSPEYNASMPGNLKNVIDWVSRCKPQPFNELHGLLLSASPSMVGGNRGLWALRVPFEHLGARVFPDMFSLAQAHKAFDESGRLLDAELQRRFDANIQGFMSLVEASTNYPCAKKAWVEYLGQSADPVLDRVE
jgi:chromate reductase